MGQKTLQEAEIRLDFYKNITTLTSMNLTANQYRFNVRKLAGETTDAYSYSSFSVWKSVVAVFAKRGFNSWEAEAIIRSKHLRWAADCRKSQDGHANHLDVARYLDKYDIAPGNKEVNGLVMQTFGEEHGLELNSEGVPCRRGTMPGNYDPNKTILVPLGTPLCLDPTSETYWSS